jgi:hypothetical protein
VSKAPLRLDVSRPGTFDGSKEARSKVHHGLESRVRCLKGSKFGRKIE